MNRMVTKGYRKGVYERVTKGIGTRYGCGGKKGGRRGLAYPLKCLARIEEYGHRAFIHQFHLHHFLEATGFAGQVCGSDALDKELIEPPSVFGRSGGIERWAPAAAHVSVQSELRNREHAASHVLHAAVHFSLLVFE